VITIIDATYKNMTSPAMFVDSDFGEYEATPHHVCSGHTCRERGNVNRRKTNVEKYGCEVSSQNEDVKAKNRETCFKNHGVENIWQKKEVHEKAVRLSAMPEARQKAKNTCVEKYGVENPFAADVFKEKSKQTLIKNHGVSTPMHSELIKAKYDWKLIKQREHESRRLNGTTGTSKSEHAFFLCLNELYDDVDRWVTVNGWSIDFHIVSLNTYVQFDGAYWHGLDRPLEVIQQHKTRQDKIIETVFFRDIEQVQWFETHGMKLVRVTDKEFKKWQKEKTVPKKILEKLTSQKN